MTGLARRAMPVADPQVSGAGFRQHDAVAVSRPVQSPVLTNLNTVNNRSEARSLKYPFRQTTGPTWTAGQLEPACCPGDSICAL